MSYLQTDRRKNKFLGRDRILGVVIGVILIVLGSLFSEKMVSGIVWVKNIFNFNKSEPQYAEENQDPQYLNAKIASLESENEGLKNFLGANDGVNVKRPKGSLFSVAQRPPFSPFDTIVVNGGSDNGIQVDDLAFASADVLVGYVTAVFPSTSIVTLYSSSGQRQEVYAGTSSEAVASEGRGGGNFYIKVPSETKITVGDPIIWPSMQNILIGVVNKVDAVSGDAFSYVFFRSLIPIYSIRYVEIVPSNF
ncbi:MAG: rod shape-determining protein MreC [bacterium]